MNSYFISYGSKFRDRPLTKLPVALNKDLPLVSDDKLQLTSLKDLENFPDILAKSVENDGGKADKRKTC